VGTLLIPTRCLREEGTSYHYVTQEDELVPDEGLAALVQAAVEAQGQKVVLGAWRYATFWS
jgi:uridine phosphorylase